MWDIEDMPYDFTDTADESAGGEDEGIESVLEGIRHLYRKAGYPTKALGILCIFDGMTEDEMHSFMRCTGAKTLITDGRQQGTDTIVIDTPTIVFGTTAYSGLDTPTLTKRRVNDIMAEYLLRLCYDHVSKAHDGTDHESMHLPFIVCTLGGRHMVPNMVERMPFRDDKDIVEVGKLLKAMDVIERKVDDDRVRKTYLDLKGKPYRTLELERKTRFHTVFGRIEFDPKVTEEDERGMWLCFQELRNEGILPEIPGSKGLCFKVRRMSDYGGQYVSSPKFLIICDYGTFVHEYAHALDHAMGLLSSRTGFANILKHYRQLFDRDGKDRRNHSDDNYYKSRAECFARCFEMYVMMRHGPCILLREYYPKWAYPDDPTLKDEICEYFDRLCGKN